MSEGPLRVCLVAPLPPPCGGIAQWTLLVSHHAAARADVELRIVDISTRWRAGHDLALWKRALGGGLQLVRDSARLGGQLRTRPRPDAVHLTTSGQLGVVRDLAVMHVARRSRVPVIYHVRFGRVPQLAGGTSLEWKLLARAMRMAHTVVAIDVPTERALRTHLPEVHVVRVTNCLDLGSLPAPAGCAGAGQTVMFLGNVIPSKGVEELVQAWAELRPDRARLLIVGEASTGYRQQLLRKYQPAGVEFIGERPHAEAMELMSRADVFTLPSYTEGFPNVIAEAMALGRPIVATVVGAIPEMLADGCGVLIQPRDAAGLRVALSQVLADADLRERLGARARERAMGEYSIDRVFDQYMGIWRRAAGLP